MHRALRALALVTATATLLAASALPAAALTIKGDGYFSRWSLGASNPLRGLAVVDNVVGHDARLNALLIGLEAGQSYSLVGRSIGCNGTPSAANRVFRVTRTADADGDISISRAITLGNVGNLTIVSMSMFRTEDATPFSCVNASAFEVATGDVNGDDVAGVIMKDGSNNVTLENYAFALVEKQSNGRARLSIVVDPHDLTGNTYVVSLANRACGKTPTASIKVEFQDVLVSSFKSKTIDMTQGQLDGLRSIRIRNVNDAADFGCAPLSVLIALLLP
jgi:hypothetical protein